jgi:hypothetical protein
LGEVIVVLPENSSTKEAKIPSSRVLTDVRGIELIVGKSILSIKKFVN